MCPRGRAGRRGRRHSWQKKRSTTKNPFYGILSALIRPSFLLHPTFSQVFEAPFNTAFAADRRVRVSGTHISSLAPTLPPVPLRNRGLCTQTPQPGMTVRVVESSGKGTHERNHRWKPVHPLHAPPRERAPSRLHARIASPRWGKVSRRSTR